MYPVSIHGRRLVLREFRTDDAEGLHSVYGDPVATEHLSFQPRSLEEVATMMDRMATSAQEANRIEYALAIATIDSDLVIGSARLAIDSPHSAQIGFALRSDLWGKRLGSETVALLLQLGIDELGMQRVWGARSPLNDRSARLMTGVGMAEEGRIRAHVKVGDNWRDSITHSILADEWSEAAPRVWKVIGDAQSTKIAPLSPSSLEF